MNVSWLNKGCVPESVYKAVKGSLLQVWCLASSCVNVSIVACVRSVLMELVLTSRPLPRFPAQDNGSAGQEYHRPTVDDFLSEDAQFV